MRSRSRRSRQSRATSPYWDKIDHWLEEGEEIFGHARDPYARVVVRPISRRVEVSFNGEVVAKTRRVMFLFETGHPTRYTFRKRTCGWKF